MNRDRKDFAIEFGGYLATAVEHFMSVLNDELPESVTFDDDVIRDHWSALQSAIYEFRTRAAFAVRGDRPADDDIMIAIREIARG